MKLILTVLTTFCLYGCMPDIKSEAENESFRGVVISKFKSDVGCFGTLSIKDSNQVVTDKTICYCVSKKQDIWSYILPNDTIYKKKGDLYIQVTRNTTTKKYEYPLCIR